MEEKTKPPKVHVEVIDAVAKGEKDWAGVTQTHIEYLLKMSIEGNTASIKIVGKRFSDLSDLHKVLHERHKVDTAKAPAFPDKNNLHQNWWKLNDKDPASEFVQQRRAALETYLNKLFDGHPGLPFDPLVMAFFQLEELSMEVAIATSMKTAKFTEQQRASDTAHVTPQGPRRRGPNSSPSVSGKTATHALTDEVVDV